MLFLGLRDNTVITWSSTSYFMLYIHFQAKIIPEMHIYLTIRLFICIFLNCASHDSVTVVSLGYNCAIEIMQKTRHKQT